MNKKDSIEEAIQEINDEFKKNPANFFTEGDIVSKFYTILSEKFDKYNVKIKDIKPYRNDYLLKISNDTEIYPIHTEVPLIIEDEDINNRRIDIGIFKNINEKIKYKLKNGSKKFYPEDFSVAIEIKFIKNRHNLNKNLKDRFIKDIKKLSRFKMELKNIF